MPRVARVAALLLLYCAPAAAGRPAVPLLSRLRADRQQQQQQPPLPPRRPGPLRRPAPPQRSPAYPVPLPAINGTAGAVAAVLIALSSNWVVYERLSWLVTALGRWSVGAVRTLFVRTLHFPPTVTLVTMRGLIATDDEMRTGLSYAMLAPEAVAAPERGARRAPRQAGRSWSGLGCRRRPRCAARASSTWAASKRRWTGPSPCPAREPSLF